MTTQEFDDSKKSNSSLLASHDGSYVEFNLEKKYEANNIDKLKVRISRFYYMTIIVEDGLKEEFYTEYEIDDAIRLRDFLNYALSNFIKGDAPNPEP